VVNNLGILIIIKAIDSIDNSKLIYDERWQTAQQTTM